MGVVIPQPWRPPHLTAPREVTLTARQAAVLVGICNGRSNRQIASVLRVSEDTVKSHATSMYRAMRANDRAHAASLAMSGQVDIFVREAAS